MKEKERRRKRQPIRDSVPESPIQYVEIVSELIESCGPKLKKKLQEKGIKTSDERTDVDTVLKSVTNLFHSMKRKRSNKVKGFKRHLPIASTKLLQNHSSESF